MGEHEYQGSDYNRYLRGDVMKIKFDDNGNVLGFVELGGMAGAIEYNGDIPDDFRENCLFYKLENDILVKDEEAEEAAMLEESNLEELDELYEWFTWYDNQVAQYMRAIRLGEEFDKDISELDALAEQKQNRIRELRRV